jgi:hypothetical protein
MPLPENEMRLAAPGRTAQAHGLRTQESGHAHRHIEQAPFCWQQKPALRLIRDSCDAEKSVSSTLAVYLALTEIASDEESETFTTTHAWIALKSGLSPRTVQDRINRLSEIGLLEVSTPTLKSPSKYKLLSVRQPLPNDKQPLPNVRQSPGQSSLPSLEENNEQRNEELPERARAAGVQEQELLVAFDGYVQHRLAAGFATPEKLQRKEMNMLRTFPGGQEKAILLLKFIINESLHSVSAAIAKIRKSRQQRPELFG